MGAYASDLGSLGEEGVSFVFPLASAPTATFIRHGSPFRPSVPAMRISPRQALATSASTRTSTLTATAGTSTP